MTWKTTNTAKGDNKLYSDAGGYAPSLDLRFASDKNLNDFVTNTPLVDHQRSMSGSNLSAGTFVNSSGLIETAKVNLASNSNYGTDWSKSFFAQTPVLDAIGPDNITNSAFTLIANNSGGNNYVEAITPTVTVKTSTSYTVSFFAKADTLNYAMIRTNGFTTPADFKRAYFDLLTGVTGERNAGDSSDIVSYGGGWYRCIYTFTTDPTDTTGNFYIGLASGTTEATASYYVPLDGVSSVVLFGLQVEEGTTASPYIPTTGVASAAPRFDHDPTTGESLGLLVEESRTNILQNSSFYENFPWSFLWGIETGTVTSNSEIAPDGTTTATKLEFGAATTTVQLRQSINVTGNYAFSVFAKKVNSGDSLVVSNVSTGDTPISSGTEEYSDGWVRYWFTVTNCLQLRFQFTASVYVWGAQVEEGDFPTSYIPTNGTALTRSADVATITGSNFSSWYNPSEGTYYAEVFSTSPDAETILSSRRSDGVLIADGFKINSSTLYNRATCYLFSTGTNDFINYSPVSGKNKLAIAGSSASTSAYFNSVNGSNLATRAPQGITVAGIEFGGTAPANAHISRITYFPERLPDATLQAITS